MSIICFLHTLYLLTKDHDYTIVPWNNQMELVILPDSL